MRDNVSRQAVLAILNGFDVMDGHTDQQRAIHMVELLPSTDRKGEWIYCENDYGIDGYRCDKCGYHVPWDYTHKSIYFIEEYNFCPSCGADMRGEQE